MVSKKYEVLQNYLKDLGSLGVAFSGGVDSTFLLQTAHQVLGDQVLAVTVKSCSFPGRELEEAAAFCRAQGIRHRICETNELDIPGFADNPPHRCYLCKKGIFSAIFETCRAEGISHLAEGSNMDDMADFRPGHRALEEMGVLSPLREAQLTKEEIRSLSKDLGLKTWSKPSYACLTSRFPYGEKLTVERLGMIDQAEQFLLDEGFVQIRVRYHGNLARIETDAEGFKLLEDPALREKIYRKFKTLGFSYVSQDLLGYRLGSMNETLEEGAKEKALVQD
ncbi:MAG: ATP-dependent sacrificial sulfur transferase LarE [Treponema sp.]|nr:ATP-dependent sacrificial sulfur transferase LarE [Treponema sp.]